MRKDTSTEAQNTNRAPMDLRRGLGRDSQVGGRPRVLAVGLADHSAIFRALASAGFPVGLVNDCREMREHLRQCPAPDVVVTATSLRDGNWCDILTALNGTEAEAALILCSSIADQGLWSEAIWRGVHDVLVTPLDLPHVMNSIESAQRTLSREERESASAMRA
jgi:DNA-binding NtrC family response regulator